MKSPVRVPEPVTGEPVTLNTDAGSAKPTELTPPPPPPLPHVAPASETCVVEKNFAQLPGVTGPMTVTFWAARGRGQ